MYTYIRFFLPMLLGWVCAQAPKVTYKMVTPRSVGNLFETIMASGGMPSTHTASVMAMVTRIAFVEQFKGPLFALAIVFAFVTMYDAFNVRLAVGHVMDRVTTLPDTRYEGNEAEKPEKMPVVNGHTFPEVAVGFAIGVAVGIIYSFVESRILG